MKHINLSIGLNDRETLKQEISTENALILIKTALYESGMDATVIPCNGIYTMEKNGARVIENSFRLEFYGAEKTAVVTLAKRLCRDLNQETIAYSEFEIQAEFIGA